MLQDFHDHHGGDHGWPIAFGYWCQYYDTKHVLSRPEAAKALKATKLNYSSLEWRILQWFQCIGLALSYLKCPKTLGVCHFKEKHFITVSVSVNTVAKNSHSILVLPKLPVDSNPQSIRLSRLSRCHDLPLAIKSTGGKNERSNSTHTQARCHHEFSCY